MVARLLLWLMLGVVVWWVLRSRRKAPPRAGAARTSASPVSAETMVDCARCGLHLPASEALHDGEARVYCSSAHRDAGPRSGR